MSQNRIVPRSSVCRCLNFNEEVSSNEEIQTIVANGIANQNHEADQPEHLEEARLDNMRNTFAEELQRSRNESKIKWNFDFETETPLDGKWEWEKIENKIIEDGNNGRENVQ